MKTRPVRPFPSLVVGMARITVIQGSAIKALGQLYVILGAILLRNNKLR